MKKLFVIKNCKTNKYLSFAEKQPIWVSKAEASLHPFTIDQIRAECWSTFRNDIKDIDWECINEDDIKHYEHNN